MADLLVDESRVPKDHDIINQEVSELISVKEFKEKMVLVHKELCREGLQGASTSDIMRIMGVSQQVFQECAEHCSPKGLILDGSHLELQHQKRGSLPKDTGLESIDNMSQTSSCFNPKTSLVPAPGITQCVPNLAPAHLVSYPEIILAVLLFHPTMRRPQAEYHVLGCQKLSELKDALFCLRDYNVTDDYSDHPHKFCWDKHPPPTSSKSGFFFINNTFYNDMREVEAEDYSSVIIKWAESNPERISKSSRLDHFKKADMHTTTFEQLSVRLGYPYLYTHHGKCEHGIMFTDLRLLNPSDVQDRRRYPLLCQYLKTYRKRCGICEEFTARWVTVADQLAAESPAFFCKTCFLYFHYDSEGKKVEEFQAYPYFDEVTTLLESNAPPPDMSC